MNSQMLQTQVFVLSTGINKYQPVNNFLGVKFQHSIEMSQKGNLRIKHVTQLLHATIDSRKKKISI